MLPYVALAVILLAFALGMFAAVLHDMYLSGLFDRPLAAVGRHAGDLARRYRVRFLRRPAIR